MPTRRLAYLVSQYPASNHTAIGREIRGLRKLGIEVAVISVREPDRPLSMLTASDRAEYTHTYYVKRAGVAGALRAQVRAFLDSPLAYVGGLVFALRLGGWQIQRSVYALLYFVEAVLVGCYMREHQLAQLHCHYSSTVGLLVRRTFAITLSMTIHGPAEFADPHGFRLRDKIAESEFVCAISDHGKRQLLQVAAPKDRQRVRLLRLGIDVDSFAPGPFRAAPSPFEILSVGRLAPVKQYDVLLMAVQRLLANGLAVQLRLVGDGEERERLQAQAWRSGLNGHVVFEGWRGEDDVRALYSRADAFALASRDEGLPMVLMEAMAMQLPCVATAVAGVPELIRDEIDGLLVSPGSVDQMTAALDRLVHDAQLRKRLGDAGRQRVLDQHQLDRHARQLAAFFLAAAQPA